MGKYLQYLAQAAVWCQGKKTYMLALGAIAAAWWAYLMGYDPNVKDAIDATGAALATAFLRHGITTEAKGP